MHLDTGKGLVQILVVVVVVVVEGAGGSSGVGEAYHTHMAWLAGGWVGGWVDHGRLLLSAASGPMDMGCSPESWGVAQGHGM